jgi:hypothetical protein
MIAVVTTVIVAVFFTWAWLVSRTPPPTRPPTEKLRPQPTSWENSAERIQLHAADNIRQWGGGGPRY